MRKRKREIIKDNRGREGGREREREPERNAEYVLHCNSQCRHQRGLNNKINFSFYFKL
jgi:hypothetical protein